MFTIDRINRLREHYGWKPVPYGWDQKPHDLLDALDRKAGFDSTGGRQESLYIASGVYRNEVGKRATLHEINAGIGTIRIPLGSVVEFKAERMTPPYFWLGAEGERVS